MPKLDELIRELCPDGVEYKPMSEVIQFLNGRAYKQTELLDNGKYKVLRVGNFYTNENWYYSDLELEPDKYCERGDLLYTWAATLGPQIWNEDKAIFHYHIWKLKFDENLINKKFLYHFLSMDVDDIEKSLTKSTMPHVSMASMNKRMVPLPPLEIQREIVRILDNFINLTAELTAELTARKAQYSYYRDKLLQYETIIEELEIGEVCNLSAGGDVPKDRFSKEKTERYKIPIISNGSGINALYGYTDIPKIVEPSVTVAARGTIGYAEYRDYPYFPIIRLITITPKDVNQLNAKYLYYCLEGRKYKVPMSGIPQLTVPMLKKQKVSIPSLEIQNRIVNVLDNFEKICSDLNIGLPAEIKARQKQYEYYRDKLLTFAETGNTILSRAEQSRAEQSRAEQSRAEQSRAEH